MSEAETNRGQHDIGGLNVDSLIDRSEHRLSLSERRVDAMMNLLFAPDRKIFNIDEMRRAIETLPSDLYENYNYYERWTLAMEKLLIGKGIMTADEITAKVADVRARLKEAGVSA
ncbi:MAG: nitrile hydratase subunit beta [Alphaproteobacteria bacterium]|nr:nitrile hydratase subunit beta [Alphaproteobacteria bacterium]MBT4019885.1 nitrile hydratase subunit beta [Alphaproteobacteria bacterium]MBT4965771.1 nitrile hydratase subunit beta [Alphaproteobacteria bacterium]MBT5917626.1 nitrile hydratase subunit beta [Alphaproteobacteria bacterium]MBT7747407.1 nitrile hydratase subunit beta [Alphaproteobacteria bacterium]